MESKIKLEYKPVFGKFGKAEPLISVKIKESEDPRDSLLKELFNDKEEPLLNIHRIDTDEPDTIEYRIYEKNETYNLLEIASQVFMFLTTIFPLDDKLMMIEDVKNCRFETEKNGVYFISNGVNLEEWWINENVVNEAAIDYTNDKQSEDKYYRECQENIEKRKVITQKLYKNYYEFCNEVRENSKIRK